MAAIRLLASTLLLATATASANEAEDLWQQWQLAEQQAQAVVAAKIDADPSKFNPLDIDDTTAKATALQMRLEALADKGDTTASYYAGALHQHLALRYGRHMTTEVDLAVSDREFGTALHYWRPLAEAGDPQTQFEVGKLYEHGWGVTKSPLVAIDWYAKAATGYRKAGDREHALTVLDAMRQLDPDHPATKKLYRQLVTGQGAP